MIAIDNFCRVITSPFVASFCVVVGLLFPATVSAQNLPVSRLATLRSDWAFADFDGDLLPDLAIADAPGTALQEIRVRLSSGSTSDIRFNVQAGQSLGLTLRAQDVDGDHDLDLVITAGISHQPVGVWLNDGAGKFTQGDSSLYPQLLWRGPPAMFARPLPSESIKALTQTSRSVRCCETEKSNRFRACSRLPLQLPPKPSRTLLAGPGRVRPPPNHAV